MGFLQYDSATTTTTMKKVAAHLSCSCRATSERTCGRKYVPECCVSIACVSLAALGTYWSRVLSSQFFRLHGLPRLTRYIHTQ
jgi:hypothetical protein